MKILAFRGKNLASLEGDFEIDLRKPPLGQAGLFAITGPTGAGKSTLLDTVCLALFGKTPRLDGQGVRVGLDPEGEMLSSGDARSILRKGTAQAYAEVDFLGGDGVAYRARWEVRRAHGRPGGRLMEAEMRLHPLADPTPIGQTKTETIEAIRRVVGFDFKQFCRSVLLAQGDFAAFLTAAPGERTALLEKITGAEIYKELSIAAHKRAGEEKARLDDLMKDRGRIHVFTEEERAALALRIQEQDKAVEDAQRREEEEAAAERWHDQRAALVTRLDDARKEETKAQKAWDGSRSERGELDTVRAAQPLRATLQRADDADGKENTAEADLREQGEELKKAREAQGRAAEAMYRVQEVHAQARSARDAASNPLSQARRIDLLIVEAFKEARKAEEVAGKADEDFRKREGDAAAAAKALEAAILISRTTEAWLRAHAAIEGVAKDWALWDDTFARLQAADVKRSGLETTLPGLSKNAQDARDALAKAGEDHEEAEQRSKRTAEDRELAEKAARGLPRKQYQIELEKLRIRQEPAGRMKDLIPAIAGLARDRQVALDASSTATSEAIKADDESAHAARQLSEIDASIETADRDLRRHLQAVDLEAQRPFLESGKPCPLCGSPDHPWADAGAPSPDLQALKSRIEDLKGKHQHQTKRRAQAQAGGIEKRRKAGEEGTRAALDGQRLEAQRKAWAAERGRFLEAGIPEDPLDPSAAERLAEAIARLDARIAELRVLDGRAEEAEAAATRAGSEENKALVALHGAAGRMTAARGLSVSSDAAEKACKVEIERMRGDRRKALSDLAAAFQAWPDAPARIDRDPSGFRSERSREVGEWNAHRKEGEATAQGIHDLQVKARLEEAARDGLGISAQRAREDQAERGRRHADLTRDRRELLGGRDANEVERELEGRLTSASDAFENARKVHEDSGKTLATAVAREDGAREALESAGNERKRTHEALEAELEAKGLDLATLPRLLSRDEGWIRDREQAHEVMRHAMDSAVVVHRERCEALELHEASGRQTLGPEDARSAREAAARDLERGQELLQTAKVERQKDQDDQHALEVLRPQTERQEKTNDLWQKMRELIGSADGVKFSRFAQSLTFEILLACANQELERLTRRYRLLRVPGTELDFQVSDLDMGNEVRGLNSLSGGETFLVSLGLALGLSSLSSRQMRVGSLFIDEGFGTLDPETLDVAISALEKLGAADRQVGIISHVSGLADRIGAQVRVVRQGQGRSIVKVDPA